MSSTNFMYEGGKYVRHSITQVEPAKSKRHTERYKVTIIGELPKKGGSFDVTGFLELDLTIPREDQIEDKARITSEGLVKMWAKRTGKIAKFKTALAASIKEALDESHDHD